MTMIISILKSKSPQLKYPKDKFYKSPIPNKPIRILQERKWRAMEVFFDYSRLDSNFSDDKRAKFIKRMLQSIRTLMRAYWKVYAESGMIFGRRAYCSGYRLPGFVRSANLYVIVDGYEGERDLTLAMAGNCLRDSYTDRPGAGTITINLSRVFTGKTFQKEIFSLLFHELFHILGFNGADFARFRDSNNQRMQWNNLIGNWQIGDTTYSVIKMESVVKEAREFYGCDKIKGLPVEDGGGRGTVGAHLENTFFPNELMCGYGGLPTFISTLSLSVMEASSWYKIDHSMAEPTVWGKGDGCYHFSHCPPTTEYCQSPGASSCSEDYTSRASCQRSGQCYHEVSRSRHSCIYGSKPSGRRRMLERVGTGSSCFMSTWSTSHCLSSRCENNKIIISTPSKENFECERTGQTFGTKSGVTIICPDVTKFCAAQTLRCENDCSKNGYCMKGNKCFCYSGFKGEQCEIFDEENSEYNEPETGELEEEYYPDFGDEVTVPTGNEKIKEEESFGTLREEKNFTKWVLVVLLVFGFFLIAGVICGLFVNRILNENKRSPSRSDIYKVRYNQRENFDFNRRNYLSGERKGSEMFEKRRRSRSDGGRAYRR